MKRYSIHLKIGEYGDEEKIKKQFKAAKKIFLAAIEKQLLNKQIVLKTEQNVLLAVELSIEETALDEMIELFRTIEIVAEIDAEYTEPKKEVK